MESVYIQKKVLRIGTIATTEEEYLIDNGSYRRNENSIYITSGPLQHKNTWYPELDTVVIKLALKKRVQQATDYEPGGGLCTRVLPYLLSVS